MTNNAHIIEASNQITQNGFEDYYNNLVGYFSANTHDNLSYSQFANRTNRATEALICEKEAIFYTVAYAWQHYLSLQHLFEKAITFRSEQSNEPIKLRAIDYGCGQGVATLALMDFMAQRNVAKGSHLLVYLIEPSQVSLGIARYLIERMAHVHGITVDIHTQQCNLENAQLPNDDSYSETLHLMLNILDIKAVQQSLATLTKKIQQLSGTQILFASSPAYSSQKGNTETGFQWLKQYIQNQQTEVNIYYDKLIWLNYNRYYIKGADWQNHCSPQRMMVMEWECKSD